MELRQGREVDVGQAIAGNHQKGVVAQGRSRVFDAAGGADLALGGRESQFDPRSAPSPK